MVKKNKTPTRTPLDPVSHRETKVHPCLQNYFGYSLTKSAFALRRRMDDELAKHGLMAPHFGLLRVIEEVGATSQIRLGDDMGIDKATIVKFIDELEALGLVERHADAKDRRIKNVTVTAKGRTHIPKLRNIYQEVEADFLSVLTKSEAEALKSILPKLLVSHSSRNSSNSPPPVRRTKKTK